jgi:hypothetical protein
LVERVCAPLVKPNRIDSPIVRHGGLESRGEVACGREPVCAYSEQPSDALGVPFLGRSS